MAKQEYDMVVVNDFTNRNVSYKKGTKMKILNFFKKEHYQSEPDDNIYAISSKSHLKNKGFFIDEPWLIGWDSFSENVKFISDIKKGANNG